MTDRFERPETGGDVVELLRKRTHELGNAIQAEREERLALQADIVGRSGTNGKLGPLARELAEEKATRKAFASKAIAAIAASLVTAGLALYGAGVKRGTDAAELQQLKAQFAEFQMFRAQFFLRLLDKPAPTGGVP